MFSFLSRTSSASNLIAESNHNVSTAPVWLPPLNSHLENYITVELTEQPPRPTVVHSGSPARFDVNFKAEVNFVPEKKTSAQKSFPGLSVHETFSIPFSIVVEGEDLATPLIELMILKRSSIGYACSDIQWMEKLLDDKGPRTRELIDQSEVCKGTRAFLLAAMEKERNAGRKCIAVELTVRKEVVVCEEELETLNNWYEEEKEMDPGFEDKYWREIRRARTMEEMDEEYEAIIKSIEEEENEA